MEFVPRDMADAIAAWVKLTTRSVGGRIEHWNGVWMCDLQSSHPYRNAAVVTKPLEQADIDALLERLMSFYGRDHGWVVVTVFPIECDDERLHYSLTEPILQLDDPKSFTAPDVEGLTIVDVRDAEGVLQFERLHAELFPRPHLQTADDGELWSGDVLTESSHLFMAYVGEVPVATGASWETDRVNEIMSLTTRPSHRGRGIARSMMRYAIGKSDKTPVLFSSLAARRAYERMGFRVVGSVDYWVPRDFEARYPGGWND